MLEAFLYYLVEYGLKNNLVVNGAGVVVFQREKMYTSYRMISNLFLILGIVLSSTITYFLYTYIYSKYDLYNISVSVNVLIVGAYNILVSAILKKKRGFNSYVYENSFSYAYDTVFILSVVFSLDMTVDGGMLFFFMSLLSTIVVIFITNIIIGFFVRNCNRGYLNDSFRNVVARLFLFAIFAVIFYYTSTLDIPIDYFTSNN